MAWDSNGSTIIMTEGDFGVSLPIKIDGIEIDATDSIKLSVKRAPNGSTLLESYFGDIQNNTIDLILTAEESAALAVGVYVYSLDWYKDGAFMCNLVPTGIFRVVDKA